MGLEAYKLIYGTRIYCGSDLSKHREILTLYKLFFSHAIFYSFSANEPINHATNMERLTEKH